MRTAAVACALLAGCALVAARAHAQELGPFFEPEAFPRSGYELRVRAVYHAASRTHFATPVFLFATPVQRIAARELRLQFDVRLALTPQLALQAIVPLSARFADVRFDGLLVSSSQQLASVSHQFSNFGLSDPTLLLSYRVLQLPWLEAYAEGGTRMALSDNPGGQTLPRQLPLGTGQSALLLAAGASAHVGRSALSAVYRFEYDPGHAATYLIREVGPQAYTSGSLDSRIGHSVVAQGSYLVLPWLSLRLTPEWSVMQLPRLLTRQGSVHWLAGEYLQEFALSLELRWHLSSQQALALDYRQSLLSSWTHDPFFPIAMPRNGLGVTWLARGF